MDTIRRIYSSLRDTSRKLVRLGDGGLCVRHVAQGAAGVLAVPCLCSSSGTMSLQCCAGFGWVGVLRSGMLGRGQPRDLCGLGVHQVGSGRSSVEICPTQTPQSALRATRDPLVRIGICTLILVAMVRRLSSPLFQGSRTRAVGQWSPSDPTLPGSGCRHFWRDPCLEFGTMIKMHYYPGEQAALNTRGPEFGSAHRRVLLISKECKLQPVINPNPNESVTEMGEEPQPTCPCPGQAQPTPRTTGNLL